MCGIIGINSKKDVVERLILGLHRLEYRGYDSAGISFINQTGLHTIKTLGKVQNLANTISKHAPQGNIGIAHTRWATHGSPCDKNAHPHSNGKVSVIHNGIIENHLALREMLINSGAKFLSDTDSEVIPHLISMYIDQGCSNLEATRQTLNQLHGAFGILVIFANDPLTMIAAKRYAPICVGLGAEGTFIGSDAYALSNFVDYVQYLENDDIAVCSKESVTILDAHNLPVIRKAIQVKASDRNYSKGLFPHYMLKEIFEQPTSAKTTLEHYITENSLSLALNGVQFQDVRRIYIIACGTSLFAGMIMKHWLQELAHISVETEISSEFCYRGLLPEEHSVGIFISQSGETADTIAALRFFNGPNRTSISVVNNAESTIGRESNICLPIYAGPEIGVATTKAFISQLITLACLTIKAASDKTFMPEKIQKMHIEKLLEIPGRISMLLDRDQEFQAIAAMIASKGSLLYLGRGISYAIALEGALKLKELSYIHAEAIAAGELKHGSIALVDENMYAIVIAPQDRLFLKTMSNVQTVVARRGNVILLSNEAGCAFAQGLCRTLVINYDEGFGQFVMPMLYTIPLQLIAYHVAVLRGHNVDQPRNLAKSVTVE